MFSNERNIASLGELLSDVRQYAALCLQRMRLDFVSKLIVLLSALLLSVVLLVIFAVALLFLSGALVIAVAPAVGGLHVACALVALVCLLSGACIYRFRQVIIVRPLTRFIARLFLETNDRKEGNDAAV